MSEPSDLGTAVALGLGGGLRAIVPAAALAVHGRGPLAGRARFIVRLALSATGGRVLAGGPGVPIAVAAAVGAAFAGSRLRVKVHGRGRQLLAAVAEDALSYSLVLSATSALH